jgi:hypothetical protein
VFGHDTWVSQEAHPYFFKTIQPHITQMQAEVAQTLNDITALIEHGSQE